MNVEKMKKWLELTNQVKKDDFWSNVFNHKDPQMFFDMDRDIPLYDVYKNDTHISIIFELPGVTRQDIKISLNSNTKLLIKGIVKPLFPMEFEVKKERYYGEFEREIELPEPTDAKSIQVHFQDGLMQVSYPRQNESVPFNEMRENNEHY